MPDEDVKVDKSGTFTVGLGSVCLLAETAPTGVSLVGGDFEGGVGFVEGNGFVNGVNGVEGDGFRTDYCLVDGRGLTLPGFSLMGVGVLCLEGEGLAALSSAAINPLLFCVSIPK